MVPGEQAAQAEAPGALLWLPGGHGSQAVASTVLLAPAGQGRQPPCDENSPARHTASTLKTAPWGGVLRPSPLLPQHLARRVLAVTPQVCSYPALTLANRRPEGGVL